MTRLQYINSTPDCNVIIDKVTKADIRNVSVYKTYMGAVATMPNVSAIAAAADAHGMTSRRVRQIIKRLNETI